MADDPRPLWLGGEPLVTDDVLAVPDRGALTERPEQQPPAARVALAGPEHLERALALAHGARDRTARFPRHERRRALLGVAAGLRARADEFAHCIVTEMGKPLGDARGEVERAVTTFELAAEACDEAVGEFLDLGARAAAADRVAWTRRVPVGVCGFITPFNFPLNLVAHKVAPAIAAGCPFVLKPSDKTPLSALALGELLAEQGLPHGSWSVLPLDVEHVGPLVEDPRVALLSFTGSEAVGWDLARRAGGRRVALELGGNAACIVGARADLPDVVERLLAGAYGNSGQSCISVQRVLVARPLFEPLREALAAAVRELPVGDPRAEDTRVGPLVDLAAAERVSEWIEEAVVGGARVVCGGERDGRSVRPTVLEGAPAGARIETEELFGPALTLAPFDRFEEALERADRGRFGLQLGLFGFDLLEGLEAADRVAVGGLILNDVPTFRADAMPYGGRRRSGLGREGPRSAIEEFTEPQVVVLRRR